MVSSPDAIVWGIFYLKRAILMYFWCHRKVGVRVVPQGLKRLFFVIIAPPNVGSCVLSSWEEVAMSLIIEYALIGVTPYKWYMPYPKLSEG